MKTKILLPAAILALLAPAAVALGGGSTKARSASARTMTFAAHDEPGNFALEDLGAKSSGGPDIGDVLALTQTLTSHGRRAGLLHLTAIGVDHRRHLTQGTGTVTLARGTISIAGIVPQSPEFSIAVVGGTGAYTGAKGTLTVTTPRRASEITIKLEH